MIDSGHNLLFKIVLIGDSGVGKSNLMIRYTVGEFNLESQSTIGVEFMCKVLKIESQNVKLQIWDTAGQERFRSISRSIYHGAKGIMIVYDITNQQSFDDVPTWINELSRHVNPDTTVMLVGNKADLEHLRQVPRETAEAYAREQHMAFMETSALDSSNVDVAFDRLVYHIFDMHRELVIFGLGLGLPGPPGPSRPLLDFITLKPTYPLVKASGCCGSKKQKQEQEQEQKQEQEQEQKQKQKQKWCFSN